MVRARPNLGTPFGTDGPWLAAILDTLGDIADLLDARLPAPASAAGGEQGAGGPVAVSEPAPANTREKATPVVEPAPDRKPAPADDDEPDQTQVQEPAPASAPKPSLPPPPPRRGKGSGLDAWQAYANLAGVTYGGDASRDDIITACETAGVLNDGM